MLDAIIIEDEKPAAEMLAKTLRNVSPTVKVTATLQSVQESIEYFSVNRDAHIIFSDIQLGDGLSFDIFSHTRIPVIFITAYDKYIVQAFDNNGIDYLLKPVVKEDIEKAISKYNKFQSHFFNSKGAPQLGNLMKLLTGRRKTRMLVKSGTEYVSLQATDVVLIYTQDKVVYVIDRDSKKYLSDKILSELEEDLDEKIFFRANRQYIININFIKNFKTFKKVKLLVDVRPPAGNHCIIVSQETAPAFRKWMQDA